MKQMIPKAVFESGYTYEAYRELTDRLSSAGRTTGADQSETLVQYTTLNAQRMKRLDKTTALQNSVKERLDEVRCKVHWLVLSESWCGDAAQNLPILAKMAEASANIELRILLRDEHLDIMDRFLTNGGRSIPKLIIMDSEMNVTGSWGPRPQELQDMVMENKRTNGMPYAEFSVIIQKWYLANKGLYLQDEMIAALEKSGRLEKDHRTV